MGWLDWTTDSSNRSIDTLSLATKKKTGTLCFSTNEESIAYVPCRRRAGGSPSVWHVPRCWDPAAPPPPPSACVDVYAAPTQI